MSLTRDLNDFLSKNHIIGADVNEIFYTIQQEEGVHSSLNEFWQNILKKSCCDNIFDTKKFTNLLESTRFSENDIRDFFNVEYLSSEGKEEKIKEILNIKEKVLGQKCTNIKFDILLKDALWALDINSDSFYKEWMSICDNVEMVERETHTSPNHQEIKTVNFEQNIEFYNDYSQNDIIYDFSDFDITVSGNVIHNV